MTKEEFLNLDYGMVVKSKIYPGLYEIDETDVFDAEGDGRGREWRVIGAEDKTTLKAIRIDIQKYEVWDVVSGLSK